MELLLNAKVIRLKSHHNKYLLAKEDDESVCQDKKGKSSKTARWNVEFVQGGKFIRLRNCYGKYLTASDASFLLGMTGKKVVQTLPTLDSSSFSSFEWEPIRDGHNNKQIKLKSRCGDYLRANVSLPPWRNSVTHDVPHRNKTQDWILWDVDVLEIIQIQPVVEEAVAVAVELAVEVAVEVAEEEQAVEVEVVIKEAAAAAAALEGGSSSSSSGFRKFLHELNGGDNGESSGGLLAGIIGGLTA